MIQAEHAKVAEEAAKAAASKESAHAKLEAIKKKQVRDVDNSSNNNSDRVFVVIDCAFEVHQSSLLRFTRLHFSTAGRGSAAPGRANGSKATGEEIMFEREITIAFYSAFVFDDRL